MNLKKNNGFVGVDISIALIILLIFVPMITGMIYSINKTNNSIQRKTQATSVAVDVIEIAKGMSLEDLTDTELEAKIISYYTEDVCDYTTIDTDEVLVADFDNVVYQIDVDVTDYSETDTSAEENVVKTVKVVITFKVGGDSETVEISSVLT